MIFATGRPRVAFCIASGPSLTAEDVELVRRWRLANTPEERRVIAVNTTFRMAPWADTLFASNDPWWVWARQEVGQFQGQKLCHPLSGLRMVGSDQLRSRRSGSSARAKRLSASLPSLALTVCTYWATTARKQTAGPTGMRTTSTCRTPAISTAGLRGSGKHATHLRTSKSSTVHARRHSTCSHAGRWSL